MSSSYLSLIAIALVTVVGLHTVHSAYTYQKLNELMPELRQFLGRTHLGTLKTRQFFGDDSGIQIRERKSNNLRNLMRIGKRHVPSAFLGGLADGGAEGGAGADGGPTYYYTASFPDNSVQAYRPQSVWVRR